MLQKTLAGTKESITVPGKSTITDDAANILVTDMLVFNFISAFFRSLKVKPI